VVVCVCVCTRVRLCLYVCVCVGSLARCQKFEMQLLSYRRFHDNLFGINPIALGCSLRNFILENFLKICRQKPRFIKI
jgi:hypothetical protein